VKMSFFVVLIGLFLLNWSLSASAAPLNCTAHLPDGMMLNLSSMTTQDWNGNDTRITNGTKGGFDYYVRLCGNVTNANCTTLEDPHPNVGMVCQIDQRCPKCGFELSGPGNETPVAWNYTNGKDITGGVTGTAKRNGEACPEYNTTRGSIFHLLCGPPAIPLIPFVQEVNCTYTFTIFTCDACKNPSTCSNDDDSSPLDQILFHRQIFNNKKWHL